MRANPFIALFLLLSVTVFGQKYVTEQSLVSFYSHSAIEDITATNKKAASMFNATTGDIVFAIPVNEFQFEKSLMQEHFNEKYLETEKYPKSVFQGKVTGFSPSVAGTQSVNAKGKLTLHGVTREIEVQGIMAISGDQLLLESKQVIVLEDYNIKRPQIVWQNIAEQVEVTLSFTYKSN